MISVSGPTVVWLFIRFGVVCTCTGIMSGAIIYIERVLDLTTWEVEIVVASLNLVSGFGGLLAGKISDAFGRRKTIVCASILFMVGAIVMAIAQNFAVLLIGRLITGLGVGGGLVIAPVSFGSTARVSLLRPFCFADVHC